MKCFKCGRKIASDEECYELVNWNVVMCGDCVVKTEGNMTHYIQYNNPDELIKHLKEKIAKIEDDIERIREIVKARPEYKGFYSDIINSHKWRIKRLRERIKQYEEE